MTWASALALTLAIEVPVVVGLAALRGWTPGRLGLVALAAVGASLVTHPGAWFANDALADSLRAAPRVALLEGAVVAVEAALYAVALRLGLRRALVASLLSNAASFAAGLVLHAMAS